jgi:hypothetical protein
VVLEPYLHLPWRRFRCLASVGFCFCTPPANNDCQRQYQQNNRCYSTSKHTFLEIKTKKAPSHEVEGVVLLESIQYYADCSLNRRGFLRVDAPSSRSSSLARNDDGSQCDLCVEPTTEVHGCTASPLSKRCRSCGHRNHGDGVEQ